jgi:hypothetical protein
MMSSAAYTWRSLETWGKGCNLRRLRSFQAAYTGASRWENCWLGYRRKSLGKRLSAVLHWGDRCKLLAPLTVQCAIRAGVFQPPTLWGVSLETSTLIAWVLKPLVNFHAACTGAIVGNA